MQSAGNAGKFFSSSAVIVLEYCYHLLKPSGILVVSAFVDGVGNAELFVDFKSVSVALSSSGAFQYNMVFMGSVRLKVLEATDLKPAILAQRRVKSIDPYVSVHVDDVPIAQTSSKPKTSTPIWNEEFESDIENGETLGITVFHNAIMPPDPFVANSSVPLEEIINSGTSDIWVRPGPFI